MLILLLLLQPINKDVETMFAAYNDVRVANNKNILGLSSELCLIAEDYAKVVVQRNELSHHLNDTFENRLKRSGYNFRYAYELLARVGDKVTPEQIMEEWMKVKKQYILDNYKNIGIAKVDSVWVVILAR